VIVALYIFCGLGTALAVQVDMVERYPTRWKGSTLVAGLAATFFLWPAIVVALIILALAAVADR